jgi:hypothetical protein
MLSYNTGSDNALPALTDDMQSALSDDTYSDPKCMINALHYLIVRGLQYLLTYSLQCLIILVYI